jgi:hypothetical protein
VAYLTHTAVDGKLRLFTVDIIVSAQHPFTSAQVFAPKKNYGGFSVKTKSFAKAKTALERKIADTLKSEYVINSIKYEYAACWCFVYETYFGGFLRIKHVLSKEEIDEAGGKVREAIEVFNAEVEDLLAPYGWDVSAETTTRRPKNDIFSFEITSTKHYVYPETRVSGPFAKLKKNLADSETASLGFELIEWPADDSEEQLRYIIESESSFEVIDISVSCIDFDEDGYDMDDELIL